MKIASFSLQGKPGYGTVANGRVFDMRARFPDMPPTLGAAMRAGLMERLRDAGMEPVGEGIPLDSVTLLPPVPDPDKIVCIGKNYRAHVAEGGHQVAPHPNLFIRLANTLVAHDGTLQRPKVSEKLDFEGELAVIIGRRGRHVAREDALSHVAGYSLFQDASVRDYQFDHALATGKNFLATGGFGPWMTTADEIADPGRLEIGTRLNGVVVQQSGTAQLIHDIPSLIAYISVFTELLPGDVIATGTPEGVGFARTPPLWLKAGDTVEVEIPGIGVLRNHVADEATLLAS